MIVKDKKIKGWIPANFNYISRFPRFQNMKIKNVELRMTDNDKILLYLRFLYKQCFCESFNEPFFLLHVSFIFVSNPGKV